VLESTGEFRKRRKWPAHRGGARKVIIAAPERASTAPFVMGVNEETYDAAKHHIVSNASCTTNCLAPVSRCSTNSFGIKRGFMTTCHAYTMDQRLSTAPQGPEAGPGRRPVHRPHDDGAAKTVGEVIPALKGKLDGVALRVPTPKRQLCGLRRRSGPQRHRQ